MQCVICKHGHTYQATTPIALFRKEKTIIIKDVPAQICENCGEYYLSEQTTEDVLNTANKAMEHHAEVEVLKFAA
jgi:YgiT-type zinc finger domain-containing protein